MTTRSANPTIRQRHLRRELRELRAKDGRSALAVTEALGAGWSESKLTRLETTSTRPKPEAVAQLLDEYGVTDPSERARILGLVADARERGWWDDYTDILRDRAAIYIGLENEASAIRTYEAQLVPSLLQTADYARAALRPRLPTVDEATLERQVELRMRRQRVLFLDRPPDLWAILDEAAVRRMVGGPQVMREQIAHLVAIGKRGNAHLQVLPFDAGAHPGTSTFIVLDFATSVDPEVVYLESVGASTFVEDADQVVTFRLAFEELIREALTVSETREFLEKMLTDSE